VSANKAFWNDLARDLKDPEFLREYIVESMRIATVDAIVNELDDAREAAGLSKADLARAIQVEPATIRRSLPRSVRTRHWARSPRSPRRSVCASRWSRYRVPSVRTSPSRCFKGRSLTPPNLRATWSSCE
jgi:hypothetical protein